MIPALQQYPRFEKGSPSTEYQQIINFCVNYLEGVLVGLMHMDIPAELESRAKDLNLLQQKLLSRERTIRHAFQFQVEKHFSDFKSISRTRLRISYAKENSTDYTASQVQKIIETISEKYQNKHKNQLQNTARRLKTLVHRSDDNYDENPISPLNLSWAFLASIETLNLSALKNRSLYLLFDHTLSDQLGNFYNQIDLGLYYLDILAELTDPSLFAPPETDDETEVFSNDKVPVDDSTTLQTKFNLVESNKAVEVEEDVESVETAEEAVVDEPDENVKAEQDIESAEVVEELVVDESNKTGKAEQGSEVVEELAVDDSNKTVKAEQNIESAEVVEENVVDETSKTIEDKENKGTTESVEEIEETQLPELDKEAVSNIQSHLDKIQANHVEIENFIYDFKVSTIHGTLDFVNLFSELSDNLSPLVEKKQRCDIQKFTHFFTSLLNNTLLSTPLKTQLSRLSAPLLDLVLIDPFFFRCSSHPVNNFLQSIVDFELRFNHQGESLSILSQSIDAFLQINSPTLNDYQPLIESYENFKELEIIRLEKIKEEHTQLEEELKGEVLQLINEITEELIVDHDTMQFFYDDWQFLLLHLAHSSGNESAEFKNSVNIAKMLSWFIDKNKTGAHPRFESTSFKSLLTSIEIGLVTLNFSSEHRHRVRKQLINEYRQANEKQSFTVIPSEGSHTIRTTLEVANVNEQSSLDESLQFSKNLNMGDWVEIRLPSNNSYTRAKLKWKAADYSLFIFIDQRGHKIKECDLNELQQDFSKGNIKILKKPTRLGSAYY